MSPFNDMTDDQKLGMLASLNLSVAGASALVQSVMNHILPTLSVIAVIVQIIAGIWSLVHLFKKGRKKSP
jgi:hypothetical protein